jgi:hypothetical protein
VYLCQTSAGYEIELCPLMGYYAAYSRNSFPTFLDKFSVPSSRAKMRPLGTTVRNHHCTPRNSPEERTSHLLRGGSLKSCTVFTTVLHKFLINKIIHSGFPELFFTKACEADLCHSCMTKESRTC